MVPRFCLLLFAELFCLAIVTNSKQTLQEFEEGKKAVKFCHSKIGRFCPLDKAPGDEFRGDFVQVYNYSFGENDGQLFKGQLFRRIVLTIL